MKKILTLLVMVALAACWMSCSDKMIMIRMETPAENL